MESEVSFRQVVCEIFINNLVEMFFKWFEFKRRDQVGDVFMVQVVVEVMGVNVIVQGEFKDDAVDGWKKKILKSRLRKSN